MPVKQKKDLYIAKSVHDLNLKTQVDTDKNTKLKIYCKSADKMFKEAVKSDNSQDEERAYVLYMKFTSLVQYICKTKDYKAEKDFFDSLAGVRNVMTAIDKAEVLQKSLIKRYEDLKEEAEVKVKLELDEKKLEEAGERRKDTGINGDTTSKETSHKDDTTPEYGQDGGITSEQLYRLFQDDTKSILVMDARPGEDYQASHVQYAQVVSVPQEAITPGTTVTAIVKGLSRESRTQWGRRGTVDCIVLLDWSSAVKDLTKGSTLASLKDAIYKWDSSVSLKAEPLVLEGGYEGWLLRYPMFTTNPHVTRPPTTQEASSTSLTLLDFDYPSLEDDRPKPEPKPNLAAKYVPEMKSPLPDDMNDVARGPSNLGSTAAVSAAGIKAAKTVPAINRSSKPNKELPAHRSALSNSSMSPHSPSTTSGDAGGTGVVTAKPSSLAISQNNSLPGSVSDSNIHRVPSTESATVSSARPGIPNRSLKPAVQDDRNRQSPDADSGSIDTPGTGKDAIDSRDATPQEGSSDVIVAEKKDEDLGEIMRRQKESQLQEQQARQELEKMRQDKMRTENKQLRLEKATMEKELEEKVAALKHMQEELDEQRRKLEKNEAAKEEARQQTEKRQETVAATEAQSTPTSSPQQDARPPTVAETKPPAKAETKPPVKAEPKPEPRPDNKPAPVPETKAGATPETKAAPRAEAKLSPGESVSQASAGQSPQPSEESGIPRPAPAEAKKAVQPSSHPQQHSASTPASARSSPPAHSASTTTLPAGWEKKLHASNNKYYYIDHNTATTHWDPPAIGPGGAATTAAASAPTTSSTQRPEPKVSASRDPAKQTTPSPHVTKTRLKSDSSAVPPSSGLKRSFSSPNIAQMVINEQDTPSVPLVNRASKPTQRMSSSSMIQSPQSNKPVAATRARNLNPVYGNQGRSLSGLRNLGNTCFMNSVVQCLSSSAPLTHYFITDKYIVDINRQNPLGRGGNMAQEFAIVIKALWSGQYRSISPLDLRDTVTKYVPEFRKNIGHHHDSQEFLLFLLDGLHEDLNQVKKREYIKEEDLEKYPDPVAAEMSWTCHQRLNQSIIVTLFQGQFKSTVCCLTCGHKSVKFEAFMYLSLPIPSSSRCTLQQCLQKFSSEEKLTGDNAIYCSRCKINRDSAKIILIWKLPRILLIHLKRFYYEGMWRQKLQTMVDFPLVNMDMSPYTRGPKQGKPYHLHAVSNHIGTLDGGHYTACCLNVNNNRWYKFDDHEVQEASQSNVRSSAAYILFYTSVDQFIP